MPEPMSDLAAPATHFQIVLVASRLLAAFLLFWAIDDITLLPHYLLPVAHYVYRTGSVLGTNTSMPENSYYLRYYMEDMLADILRIALWLLAAGWFYRCGPRIQRFFVVG
jgi:hypothetical protein